jgi:hypothetical protein
MRLTIIRMLSNSSLSAFSSSNAVSSTQRTSSVQKVRSLSEQPQAATGASPVTPNKTLGTLPSVQPGRVMPRGSLLDLSV